MMSDENLRYAKITSEEGDKKYRLTGMYKDWYLEYASYVNLERAIPHILDGLKPVQRRILHSMKRMEDGRFNKVANIIGHTMQFHPHGDASIGDALVQLGQKELLIDTQGNWGNILTGDSAAAPRYIEARLSKFALDIVFNNKITQWKPSYDGRNQEPVAFPVKFPLLLAQGTQGIGVGLASFILPHNFNELLDACVAYLRGEDFVLYPDFPTGGLMDANHYHGGLPHRQHFVKVRARIEKRDKKTLAITEIPYGTDTTRLIKSIIAANESGKIKIRKIDDNTAGSVELVIHLANDVSPDKTIDALYKFTKCEVTLSPNACVVIDNKPRIMSVEDILRYNANRSRDLLRQELEIRREELESDWHFSSLEKIFFEERIYRRLEDNASSWEDLLQEILSVLLTFQDRLRRPIVKEDVDRLVEKPVRKISKFDIKKAEEHIRALDKELEQVDYNLQHLTEYTIDYFLSLKQKYGERFPRRTEITNLEAIEASKVIISNSKLYVNRAEGFIGTDLKKDDQVEYLCDCSHLDDVIVFLQDGKYLVTKVSGKAYVGKDILYAAVFRKNDTRTIYNVAYRDGKAGNIYVKRFNVTGVTRDKEYDLTMGTPGSAIKWFTANPNGEAETIKYYLRPRPKLKKIIFEYRFMDLAVKGRASRGNLLSRYPVQKIVLKDPGVATLGGQKVWFDADIQRLSFDPRGVYLGEFLSNHYLLAVNKSGTFYTTNVDLSNKYQEELVLIEKFDPNKVFTALYYDAAAQAYYLKRFCFELSADKQWFISEKEGSYLVALSQDPFPQVRITFGGKHALRESELVDAQEFIGQKSFRAKGKRLTAFQVASVAFDVPLQKEWPEGAPAEAEAEAEAPDGPEALEAPEAPEAPETPETEPQLFELDTTEPISEAAPLSETAFQPATDLLSSNQEFRDEDAIQMTLL